MKKILSVILVLGILAVLVGSFSTVAASVPVVTEDNGAYVRVVGDPSEGTVKFQYGWNEGTRLPTMPLVIGLVFTIF